MNNIGGMVLSECSCKVLIQSLEIPLKRITLCMGKDILLQYMTFLHHFYLKHNKISCNYVAKYFSDPVLRLGQCAHI